MKAVRLVKTGHPLELQDIPVPTVGARDVLVAVKAAGICHSDAHYRAGRSRVHPLPLTLGHEVAGVIEEAGSNVKHLSPGDRVCVHYMATCGICEYCQKGNEQFCISGKMIGKYLDGGFAVYLLAPARSVFVLPPDIPFEHAAIMMCSSATSLHALRKARVRPGESVAIFGIGGLGASAVQLARACGAHEVYAVDIHEKKLEMARRFGASPINAAMCDPVEEIRRLTHGRGVDVALELIGLPRTMEQAFRSLAIQGRVAIAGISEQVLNIAPYEHLINREAEIIGVSDHLAQEIPELIGLYQAGELDFSSVITRGIPLDATAINHALDGLESFGDEVRVIINP